MSLVFDDSFEDPVDNDHHTIERKSDRAIRMEEVALKADKNNNC